MASLSLLLKHLLAVSSTERCCVTLESIAQRSPARPLPCQSGPGGGGCQSHPTGGWGVAKPRNAGGPGGCLPPVALKHVRSELTFAGHMPQRSTSMEALNPGNLLTHYPKPSAPGPPRLLQPKEGDVCSERLSLTNRLALGGGESSGRAWREGDGFLI